MAENIKLKDLYNEEQSYTDIGTIAVPKTDGSGNTYYVQRPLINYTMQNPPTHELTDADAGVFAWNAGDGTVLVGDVGNFMGSVEASAAGKTTRPIVTITVTKHISGATVNANGAALLIYLYEELPGSVLLDVLGETGNNDFTAQVGWGQLLLADTESREITGYAKINDPGAVTIGIEQPVGYQKADIFYSLLSEVTQEEQTVSVTENGEQAIVPTAGKSGIRKVALNVNVPQQELQEKSVTLTQNGTTEVTPDEGYDGMSKLTAIVNVAGGGSGVQPDWNQNDSTAADFVKNRPGAYVQTISGQTLTFDGDTTGKYVATEWGMVKVSDEIIPKEVLQSGTFTYTYHSDSGDETHTLDVSSFISVNGMYGFVGTITIMTVVTAAAAAASGIEPGTYLGCDTGNTPPQSYVSQFVIPSSSIVVELPENLTQVKQSDWAAVDGNLLGATKGSIKNRIGGFCSITLEELSGISLSFDGTYEGKEHYIINDTQGSPNIIFVKALDYPLTKTQLETMKSSNWLSLTYGGTNYTDPKTEVAFDDVDLAYNLVAKFTANDSPASFWGLAVFPVGTEIYSTIIPPGTYWVVQSASPNNYFTGVNFSFAPIKQMPSEFLETDFSGRDVSAASVILNSSTSGSTKKFKITVDDTGTLKATEVTN